MFNPYTTVLTVHRIPKVLATVLIRSIEFLMLEWNFPNGLPRGIPQSIEFQWFCKHLRSEAHARRTHGRTRARVHAAHLIRPIEFLMLEWNFQNGGAKLHPMLVFVHSGVCEKRFLLYPVLLVVLLPLPPLFNVEEMVVQLRPRRKGIFFAGGRPPRRHASNIE